MRATFDFPVFSRMVSRRNNEKQCSLFLSVSPRLDGRSFSYKAYLSKKRTHVIKSSEDFLGRWRKSFYSRWQPGIDTIFRFRVLIGSTELHYDSLWCYRGRNKKDLRCLDQTSRPFLGPFFHWHSCSEIRTWLCPLEYALRQERTKILYAPAEKYSCVPGNGSKREWE